MKLRVLGSGSGGNAYAVTCGDTLLLVDFGFSCREVGKRLAAFGLELGDVSGVLFTHDHSDHCKGVATFHRHYPSVPLFANGNTADAIAAMTGVGDGWAIFENSSAFDAGCISVTPFPISHDAADPVGYLLEAKECALFVGTDMGAVNSEVREMLARSTCAVLESNHDPVLLEQSDRPLSLKQRIRGRTGHLSNDDAAELLMAARPQRLKTLLLGHISEQCNSPSLARKTMSDALSELELGDVKLEVLCQSGSPCEFACTGKWCGTF